ncbi:MAG: amidohydrolase family protein [Gemmatimonadaceae bacterium]
MRVWSLISVCFCATAIGAQRFPAPIIDMHLHAVPADANGPPPMGVCAPPTEYPVLDPKEQWPQIFTAWFKNPRCANPVWGPMRDEDVMTQTLEILTRRNIYGVTSGPLLDRWKTSGGERVISSLGFALGGAPSPDQVRQWFMERKYAVFGEVSIQYEGISPSDERFDPYLRVAEELDVPVGIHIGTGPPGAPYLGSANYRARLHSPLLLEDALVRHPRLRVFVMHAGWPMLDDLLALLWTHPQVYIDTGVIAFAIPRAEFNRYLQRIVEAGFGKRVLFGTDQMNWPGTIERAIDAIESAPFLSAEQKRDILYNNAARFLRLSEAEIAKHHGSRCQSSATASNGMPPGHLQGRD